MPIEGVANVNVNLNDVSIQSMDDNGFYDGVGFCTLTGVAFIAHLKQHGAKVRVDCGRNKLFLDSCATQHTMFALEYLVRMFLSKVYLRQNCITRDPR